MSAFRNSLLVLGIILSAPASRAIFGVGDIVFDPTTHAWQLEHESRELIQWAEEIKKYEDFINQQINTIEGLAKLKTDLTSRIGDWKGVYERAVSLRNRAENLRAEVRGNFRVTMHVDAGQPALVYDNHGTYEPVDMKTVFGSPVNFRDAALRPYQLVYQMNEDYEQSVATANKEIADLLTEIADTSKEIVDANDQEKLAKLQEKKATLVLRLQELQRQLDQKATFLKIQADLLATRQSLDHEMARLRVKQNFEEGRKRDFDNVRK